MRNAALHVDAELQFGDAALDRFDQRAHQRSPHAGPVIHPIDDVAAELGDQLRGRPVLLRPRDERRPQADLFRGAQIAQVRGHHHDVGRLQVEDVRRRCPSDQSWQS